MDILYIVGKGRSNSNDIELRMSLRSVTKYGKNVSRIFVAGYCPDWLSNEVIKVPVEDIVVSDKPLTCVEKHLNIINCLLKTVDGTDIGEHFLVSMDDHFYLRDVDFDNYPYYLRLNSWGKELPTKEWTFGDEYYEFLNGTRKYLESLNMSVLCATIHRNMHCARSWVNDCRLYLEKAVAEKLPCEPWSFLNNYNATKNGVEYIPVKDIKIMSVNDYYIANSKTIECFSTDNFEEKSGIGVLLKRLYNEKCKYEL